MNFEDGVARLVALLRDISWPTDVVWVAPEQVLYRPTVGTVIFRPEPHERALASARAVFAASHGAAPAVLFYGVGHDGRHSFATVERIDELAQGEGEMFVHEGLEIAARDQGERTWVVTSAMWWSVLRMRHRRWYTSTARVLSRG